MDIYSNCERHQKIKTEEAAKNTAAYMRKRSRKYAGVNAFPCDVGGTRHWHIGRSRRR
jgi:hypothetical protein